MAWTTKLGGRIPPYRNAVRFDGEPRRTRRSVMRHVPLEPLVTVIALFLVAGSPAGAQRPSDLVRRKLSAVTVIDGIACGVTGRAYAYFHPSGRLAECPLATDTVLFGQTLPARTWVELMIDGRLRKRVVATRRVPERASVPWPGIQGMERAVSSERRAGPVLSTPGNGHRRRTMSARDVLERTARRRQVSGPLSREWSTRELPGRSLF